MASFPVMILNLSAAGAAGNRSPEYGGHRIEPEFSESLFLFRGRIGAGSPGVNDRLSTGRAGRNQAASCFLALRPGGRAS